LNQKVLTPKSAFLLCWFAYTLAYFGRVNISVAIPVMEKTLGWSNTQLGLIGSSFFWIYAIGQLINGSIGDHVSPRKFVFIGLFFSALLNLAFGSLTLLPIMIVIWGINGYFQSMLWGPIVRTLSDHIHPRRNNIVAVGMAASMTVGYLMAWGLSGKIVSLLGWRWAFWTPSVILALYAFLWLIKVKSDKFHNAVHPTKSKQALLKITWNDGLWLIMIASIAQGVVKEGINLWGPMLLMKTHGLDLSSTVAYSILIPAIGFSGAILAGLLNKKLNHREKPTILIMLIASGITVMAFHIFGAGSAISGTLFLSLTVALLNGANSILMTIIPLNYVKYKRVSSVAGLLDFSAYVGAGLSGIFTGIIADKFGISTVAFLWIAFLILGSLALLGNMFFKRIAAHKKNQPQMH